MKKAQVEFLGFQWTCPHCEYLNQMYNDEYTKNIILECDQCGNTVEMYE